MKIDWLILGGLCLKLNFIQDLGGLARRNSGFYSIQWVLIALFLHFQFLDFYFSLALIFSGIEGKNVVVEIYSEQTHTVRNYADFIILQARNCRRSQGSSTGYIFFYFENLVNIRGI